MAKFNSEFSLRGYSERAAPLGGNGATDDG